ncbi:MAG: glycosyltransferase [Hyphomicrobiales bacterium]|nr:glycosyltransferase [Hyphomicrobiales bacterium]
MMEQGGGATVEIRVPTYRRPVLLERALRSALAQTDADWRCIVFDDCAQHSARPLVESLGDARFVYRANAVQRGAIGNIDQCFRNSPYAGGGFALVLEDDNYLLPEHIAAQRTLAQRKNVGVVFAGQFCEKVLTAGQPGERTSEKTLVWIYREQTYEAATAAAALLFSHAFSNGAAFWRLGGPSDFEIGAAVTDDPGMQETLRILRLAEPVFVSHEATAVWRWNDPSDSYVSAKADKPSRWRRALEARRRLDARAIYLRGAGAAGMMKALAHFDARFAVEAERAALMAGFDCRLTERDAGSRRKLRARGLALRALVPRQIAPDAFPAWRARRDPA